VQRAGYADLKIYLPNAPLVKVDRMSMAHALEVRCPFLDHRLVELAFRIPARRKQHGRNGKVLLRSLAQRRLPGRVWQLPKQGFTAPVGDWLAGGASSMFREEVLRSNAAVSSHVDVADLARRFERHKMHAQNHSYELWAIWVLERWLTTNQTTPVDNQRDVKTVGRPRPGDSR
jgi:asparagine synthase (glutamine-hydrolysing)